MKLIKKTIGILMGLIILITTLIFSYLHYLLPEHAGTLTTVNVTQDAEVYYDTYGIPHIYAQTEEDAWQVLGYVHAQDRLFQMELLRRVGGGRLAEIFGDDLFPVDKLFRTLGIDQVAKKSAALYFSSSDSAYQKLTLAYLKGINQFISTGKTPVEFTMLQIPKTSFTVEDVYLIAGYMGFSFSEAFRTDPVLSYVQSKWGNAYYNDIAHHYNAENGLRIPVFTPDEISVFSRITAQINYLEEVLPVKIWNGSNSFVIAPSHSKSGKVLFENDTHIGHGMPGVWYEAHLECPGYSLYGNFLAGFPFPLIGHTRHNAWGMTMFENDDFNFYRERQNPANDNQYWKKGQWEDYAIREEVINVKGSPSIHFTVKETGHGPLVYGNEPLKGVVKQFDSTMQNPISAWWTYNLQEAKTIQAGYLLCHAGSIKDMEEAASLIDAPGINLMYGDADGNIGWWATGKLYKLPSGADTKLILDGTNNLDDKIEFIPFKENPHAINPPSGFVYSANNQPDSMHGFLVPGYYVPEDRAQRITQCITSEGKMDLKAVEKICTDDISPANVRIAQVLCNVLVDFKRDVFQESVFQLLKKWNGSHSINAIEPVPFYLMLTLVLKNAMQDELGDYYFNEMVNSHAMKNTYLPLCLNDSSIWWDNVNTADKKETRKDIIERSFEQCCELLKTKYGEDMDAWKWGNHHTIEFVHPIGRKKPFNKIFNVGPLAIPGGNETVNNQGFNLDTIGSFPVKFGPAMRICIDFADIENAVSVLPTGQSGYFYAGHYYDQSKLYVENRFRKMMMNKAEIIQQSKQHITIKSAR